MNRILRMLVPALLCAAMLAGCAPRQEAVVPAAEPSAPPAAEAAPQAVTLAYEQGAGWDPYELLSVSNRTVLAFVYEPLFAVTGSLIATPVLAKDVSVSPDGMTTTVTLQSGVRFHGGAALTAEDVVWSFEKARHGAYYGDRFSRITACTAAGADAVTFTTATAYEDLALLLTFPVCRRDADFSVPDGTGPYKMSGGSLSLFDGWWKGAPPAGGAKAIDLTAISAAAEVRDRFSYGEISLAAADPSGSSTAEYHGNFELFSAPTACLQYIGFNLISGAFSSAALRAAVTFAVDRDAIVSEDLSGFGVPTALPVLPASPLYSAKLAAQYTYAPEKFRQVAGGESATMIVSNASRQRVASANRVAKSLTDGGVAVTVKALSPSDFTAALNAGDFDLYYAEARLSPNLDLGVFFRQDGGLCFGGLGGRTDMAQLCDQTLANSGNGYDLCRAVLTDGLFCPVAFKQCAVYAAPAVFSDMTLYMDGLLGL